MKPSRVASKGLEADAGSSGSRGEPSARMLQNPPRMSSVMQASAPPARITSASPRRTISAASPMAWAPVAQAETTAKLGPRMPRSVAT